MDRWQSEKLMCTSYERGIDPGVACKFNWSTSLTGGDLIESNEVVARSKVRELRFHKGRVKEERVKEQDSGEFRV